MRAVDLILDSGAYSAWRKQEELNVDEYIAYIQKHKEHLYEYVNLDKIPGAFGKKPSAGEVEASAQLGWKNLLLMHKEGLKPMHVFHQGERRYWLEKMLGEGLEYVGISPANDRTTKQKIEWLDEIFSFLCGTKGFPMVRTHGFGVTSLPILFRYPWFSADSVSWILFGAYGQVLVPHPKPDDSGYDYTVSPYVVHVSTQSKEPGKERLPGSVASDQMANYSAMGANMQEYIRRYFRYEQLDFESTRDTHKGRLKANCRFYRRIAEQTQPQPFFSRTGFFSPQDSVLGHEDNQYGKLRLVFTTTGTDDDSGLLTEEGLRERLISWYHIRGNNAVDIEYYVRTGLVRSRRPKLKAAFRGATTRPRLEVVDA